MFWHLDKSMDMATLFRSFVLWRRLWRCSARTSYQFLYESYLNVWLGSVYCCICMMQNVWQYGVQHLVSLTLGCGLQSLRLLCRYCQVDALCICTFQISMIHHGSR